MCFHMLELDQYRSFSSFHPTIQQFSFYHRDRNWQHQAEVRNCDSWKHGIFPYIHDCRNLVSYQWRNAVIVHCENMKQPCGNIINQKTTIFSFIIHPSECCTSLLFERVIWMKSKKRHQVLLVHTCSTPHHTRNRQLYRRRNLENLKCVSFSVLKILSMTFYWLTLRLPVY